MFERPLINRTEIVIILIVMVLAAGGFFYNRGFAATGDIVCELYVDRKMLSHINLDKDAVIKVPGRENVVLTVAGFGIAFTSSDCPDKICVNSGVLSHPGQIAVCLPNRVVIMLRSKKPNKDAPDAVTW